MPANLDDKVTGSLSSTSARIYTPHTSTLTSTRAVSRDAGPVPFELVRRLSRPVGPPLLSGGMIGGLLATLIEVSLFYAPERTHAPAEIATIALLLAATYCGFGMLLGALASLVYHIGVCAEPAAPRTHEGRSDAGTRFAERQFMLRVLAAGLGSIGVSLALGLFVLVVAPMAAPRQRYMLLSAGGPLIVAIGIVCRRKLRALGWSERVRVSAGGLRAPMVKKLVYGLAIAALSGSYVLVFVDAWSSIRYAAVMMQAFAVPLLVAATIRSVGRPRARLALCIVGALLVAIVALSRPSYASLYALRTARTVAAMILRQFPCETNLEEAALAQRLEATRQIRPHVSSKLSVPQVGAPSRGVAGSQPDIVLITVDTLRRDMMWEKDQPSRRFMPRTSAFAAASSNYRNAFAAASATIPALTQLMAGVAEHAVTHVGAAAGSFAALHPTTDTIAQRLRRVGYEARAVLGGRLGAYYPSVAVGFERTVEATPGEAMRLNAVQVVEHMLQELKAAERPLFLWGHFMEVHDFHQLDGALLDNYHRVVRDLDSSLGRLFEELERHARAHPTLIVFTSDHGEGLGEERLVAHGIAHPTTLRIPLVVQFPEGGPRIADETVGHLDLARTVIQAARAPTDNLAGDDLRDLPELPWPARHARFEDVSYTAEGFPIDAGIAAYPWLYWFAAEQHFPVLINMAEDPAGARNLAGLGLPQEAALLRLLLEKWN